MKIKKIFIGRRPARETPRNQGGGRAKRNSCQGINDVDGEKMGCPLKFGGLSEIPALKPCQYCFELVDYVFSAAVPCALQFARDLLERVCVLDPTFVCHKIP